MVRKSDPRFQRSRQALRQAFLEMSHDNPELLTVSALCDRSGVDRATFYRHVRDVSELAADTIEALADEAALKWMELSDGSGGQQAEAFALSAKYWEHMADNRRLYRSVLGPAGSAAAQHAVLESFTRSIVHELNLITPIAEADTVRWRATMIAGALYATCLAWLNDEHPAPAAEMAAWVLTELTARFAEPSPISPFLRA